MAPWAPWKVILIVIVLLAVAAGLLTWWLPWLVATRLVFGTMLMLFIPGFVIMEAAFPRVAQTTTATDMDWLERVTLSFALSIAVVPLVVYFSHLAGAPIATTTILLEIVALVIVVGVVAAVRKKSLK